MQRRSLFLLCFLFSPAWIYAQERDDDPFKRDPIFTKSLEELLGLADEDEEEREDRSPERRAMPRLSATGIDLGGGFEAGPYYSNALYSQYPNLPGIRFNRVNGFFSGLKKERMQWYRHSNFLNIPHIQPHGFIGYGTASKTLEYGLGLERIFELGDFGRLMVGGEWHKATATEDYHRVGLIESSLTAFFASYDFLDYYMMEGIGFYTVFRTMQWIETAFSFNRDTFSSHTTNTTWSLFGKSSIVRENPSIQTGVDEIDLDRYGFTFSFNPRNVLLTDRFTFSALVGTEWADNNTREIMGVNGNIISVDPFRYEKYWTTLKLFYNIEPGSVLRWRINAGVITGNVPEFKQFFVGGIGTLRAMPYKSFRGNQMVGSNIEIQLGSPSTWAGEWIRHYNLHLLFFIDSGWANHVPDLEETYNPFEGVRTFSLSDVHHNAGFGLGTGGFRVELAWPDLSSAPVFWIRLNPTF